MSKLSDIIRPLRIRSQFILGVSAIIITLVFAFVFFTVRMQRSFLQKEDKENAISTVKSVVANVSTFFLINDLDALQKLTVSLKGLQHLDYAMILSPDKTVLAHTNKKYVNTKPTDSISGTLLNIPKEQILLNNDKVLDIASPIIDNYGEIAGWVRLAFDQSYIQSRLYLITRNGILFGLIAIILSTLFVLFISSRLVKGLNQLIGVSEQINSGSTEVRANVSGGYEIKTLGKAFNKMLDQLITDKSLSDTIIRGLPGVFYITDAEGNLLRWNDNLEKLSGFSSAEVARMNSKDFLDTAQYDKMLKVRNQALTTGRADSEISIINKEGEIRNFLVSTLSIQYNNKPCLLGMAVDITVRKKAEIELEQREETLSLFVEQSPVSLAMFDTEMRYIVASPKWIEENNLQGIDIIGKCHYDLDPNITEEWKEAHRAALLKGISAQKDFDKYVNEEGKTNYIKWEIKPWYKADQSIGGVILYVQTITELVEAEQKFKSLVEKSPTGIYIQKSSRFTYVNPTLANMLEYTQDELLGMNVKNVVCDSDFHLVEENIKYREENHLSHGNYQIRIKTKTGKILWIHIYASHVRESGNLATLGTVLNITEAKAASEKIKKSESELTAFFDNVDGAACLLDTEKRYVIFNKNFILKYQKTINKEPVVGTYYFQDFPEDIKNERYAILDRVLKGTSEELDFEYKIEGKKYFFRTLFNSIVSEGKVTGVAVYTIDLTGIKVKELQLQKANNDIGERVKELQCLYQITKLISDEQKTLCEILQESVDMIPLAFRRPEFVRTRIICRGKSYTSKNFEESANKMETLIKSNDNAIGAIEIYCTAPESKGVKNLFLDEERLMVNSIADIIAGASEKRAAELAMKEQAQIFEAVVKHASEVMILLSPEFKVLLFNKTAKETIKKTRGVDLSVGMDYRQFTYQEGVHIFLKMFEDALKGKITKEEFHVVTIEGKPRWIQRQLSPAYDADGKLLGITLLAENIDYRKKQEDEILHLSRLYQFTSQINESMLKQVTDDGIFREACRLAVDQGRFRMAWIAMQDDNDGLVNPYAWAGHEKGYLKNSKIITLTDEESSKGPVGRAFNHKKIQYSNNIDTDTTMFAWREEALKRDYHSVISMPIIVHSKLIAVYTLYKSEIDFFNEEEIKLLKGVTDNIAYALDKIRIRELRRKANVELKESENKFRTLVEQSLVGVYILQRTKFVYVNPGFESIMGYSKDELVNNISFESLVYEEDVDKARKNYLSRVSGDKPSDRYTFRAIKSDGSIIYVEAFVSRIIYNNSIAVIGIAVDITDRVEEEKRIGRAVNEAQENERMQIGMELHDNVKQILAASLMNLDFIKTNLKEEEIVIETLDNLKSYTREAIDELRRLSHQLAPSINTKDSLEEKIQKLIHTMNKNEQLKVFVHVDKFDTPLHSDIQVAIYRIIQEQVNNILKYAQASTILINIKRKENIVRLIIKDDGEGFDTTIEKEGIGLENIKRRVYVLGGNVKIISSPGNGCELRAEIPFS